MRPEVACTQALISAWAKNLRNVSLDSLSASRAFNAKPANSLNPGCATTSSGDPVNERITDIECNACRYSIIAMRATSGVGGWTCSHALSGTLGSLTSDLERRLIFHRPPWQISAASSNSIGARNQRRALSEWQSPL